MISFPVPIDENFRFTLTLAASVDEVRARLDRLAMILFGSVLTVLLVAAAAIYFVTRRYFRPMSQMVTTAEQISANKLDKRLLLPAHADEVTRLGKALNDMMDRLESAFKSQRQFVTDASHELRTPITVIIGDLEYLRSQIDREDLRASIDDALSELDRLTRLVEQLLTLARIDAGKLVLERKRIRLDEILVDCVKLLRKEALKANVRVDVHVETVMEMHGDEVRLKSVILNLLENAIKYSESGGAVAARLRESPAGFAELTVSDSGPGVTDADLPKIFDRFYRGANSRAAGGGSGLGLAIAKEIVELHGGGIHAMANPEGGSLFKVQLPVDEDD
jgi:two-component system OmpR family sensor kinase